MLILVGAIWGSAFLAMKLAVASVPPLSIAAGRVLLAALLVWAYARARGFALPSFGTSEGRWAWRLTAVVAVFNTILPFALIPWGEQFVDSSSAAIVMGVSPLMALVAAHLFTVDDRMTPAKLAGVLIGLAGLLVLLGGDALAGLLDGVRGQLAVVAAALSYTVSGILIYRLAGRLAVEVLMSCVMLWGVVIAVPLALIVDRPWTLSPILSSLWALVYLGVFPTALGFVIRGHLITTVGYTFVAQSVYLVPLFGTLWGWLLLGERISPATAGALALILAGIAISQRGRRRLVDAGGP